ncbi:MAG: patatin-like phospholipase family protein [Bacteroidota bacterium]
MDAAPDRPLFGLALGGGGARGFAHVGVLKVLAREGIQADVIAGTSMGGLIGAAYASGSPVELIEREVLGLAQRSRLLRLADRIPSLQALLSGKRLETYLAEVMGADSTFADLRRPLSLVTSDLVTGREVVLTRGPLVPAMRATMSLPGIFAPVEMGRYRLVDGGILNNVPADRTRDLGADVVMAVDVLPHFPANQLGEAPRVEALELPLVPPGVRDVWEAGFVTISALTARNLEQARPDLIVRPALPADVNVLFGFTRADELIAAGERAMRAALPRLREALRPAGVPAPRAL